MDFKAEDNRPRAAVTGMFDGVHRGHRFLLECLRTEAAQRGLRPAVFTFPSHPLQLIAPESAPRLLSTPAEKLSLLAANGIAPADILFLNFTPALREAGAARFMQLLRDIYNVRFILRGFNNRFGTERHLTPDDYRRIAAENGITLVDATGLEEESDGRVISISSSEIRNALAEGNVARAARLLGHPYTLTGTVVKGQQLGRRIGFPTANIRVPHPAKLIPANGVYLATISICGEHHRVMLNIGTRPTVCTPGASATIEAHILDYEGDLYGTRLTLHFHRHLRPEQRFPSLDALAARLDRDRDAARTLPL